MSRARPGVRASRLPGGFATIWICVAVDLIGFGIVFPMLPLYAEKFGASPVQVGVLVSSFSAAQFVFAPLMGRLSDHFGRRPVLLVSLLGTAVGSLITGLAGNLWVVMAGRVVDGASGASVSVAQAAVSDVAPPDQRARLLGLLGAAFGIGFVAGPALGALATLGGPHVPFFVAAAIASVNAVVAFFRLPETANHKNNPGAEDEGEPVGFPLRSRIGDLVLLSFLSLTAFSAFEATFALFGERRLGFTLGSIGVVFALIGIVITAVQGGLIRPVIGRLGERGTLITGVMFNAVGLMLLAFVHELALLVPALLFLTIGQGLVIPTMSSLLAGRVEARRRGRALGIQQSAGSLARIIGPVSGGFAFHHLGITSQYLIGAGLVGLALVVFLVRPESQDDRRRSSRSAAFTP